jgi:hypothetical protein
VEPVIGRIVLREKPVESFAESRTYESVNEWSDGDLNDAFPRCLRRDGISARKCGNRPHPALPAPKETFIPTVNIAPVKGWPAAAKPAAAFDPSMHTRLVSIIPAGFIPSQMAISWSPRQMGHHGRRTVAASRVGSIVWSRLGRARKCQAPTGSHYCATLLDAVSPMHDQSFCKV